MSPDVFLVTATQRGFSLRHAYYVTLQVVHTSRDSTICVE